MARNLYGCTSADYAQTAAGALVAGAGPFPVYDAFTGGSAVTDLTDLDGTAITQVTFMSDGYLRYYSPDGDKSTHFVDTGQGQRIAVRPVDLTGEPNTLTVGTVTTGAAGSDVEVTITGDAPNQTIDLTIPKGDTGAAGATAAALTTKGDLLSHDGSNGVRVAKGSDNLPLIADSSAAAGIKWAQIGAAGIADAAVNADKLGAAAVDTDAIADGAVTVVKLTGAYGAKTGAYTITTSDSVIAADTTSGAFALTLPAASASTGKTLRIIKTAGANVLTVQRAGSDTILPSSGTRTSVAFPSDCARGSMLLVSTGTAWEVWEGRASDESVGSRQYEWSAALAGGSTTAAVGWALVRYDSGLRNISSLISGWTGSIFVKRSIDTVACRIVGLTGSATLANPLTLPDGFTAVTSTAPIPAGTIFREGAVAGAMYWFTTYGASLFYFAGGGAWSASHVVGCLTRWTPSTTLPTSLPGTAA